MHVYYYELLGYYTLPVSCLIEPQPASLLRTVDELFVESLKLAMKGNPTTDAVPIVGLVVLGQGKGLYINYYNI